MRIRINHIAFIIGIIIFTLFMLVINKYLNSNGNLYNSKNKKLQNIKQYLRDLDIVHDRQIRELLNEDTVSSLPIIYIVTPTYYRMLQQAELTRITQTFKHVNNLHMIVVEDADKPSTLVRDVLDRSKLRYTQLFASTPKHLKLGKKDKNWQKPRGVLQVSI